MIKLEKIIKQLAFQRFVWFVVNLQRVFLQPPAPLRELNSQKFKSIFIDIIITIIYHDTKNILEE